MSMAELVAAGAPELPAGYFYRVRHTTIKSLKVEIRRQRRFRSQLVVDFFVFHKSSVSAEAAVVEACRYAYQDWQAQSDVEERYEAVQAYVGDHDPRGGR
jgi:hypothetical protein